MTSAGVDGQGDHLRLTLPHHGDFVALARFAAGLVAARADFNIEEVQDLQLAIDEMYAYGGAQYSEDDVSLEMNRAGAEVFVSLTYRNGSDRSASPEPMPISSNSELSEQLLSALVNEHGLSTDPDGRSCIWLRKSHIPHS